MKKLLAIIAAFTLLLAGCSSGDVQTNADTPFEKNGKDGYVLMYMADDVNYFTTPTEQFSDVARYYHGVTNRAGTADVMHAPAYNGSDVVFCPDASCTHDNDSCLALFPVGTKFFTVDESEYEPNVYAIHRDEYGTVRIYGLLLYYENSVLAEIENCMFSMHSNIATDGDYLYLACAQDNRYVINQISLADGTTRVIYTSPEDEIDLSIQSIVGGNLIVSSSNKNIAPTPTTFFMVNIATGDSMQLKRVDYMAHVGEKVGVTIGEMYYEIDSTYNSVSSYNFFTGEVGNMRSMGIIPYIEEEYTQPRIAIKFVRDGMVAAQFLYTPAEGGYAYKNIFIDVENSLSLEGKLLAPDANGDMTIAPVLANLEGVELGRSAYVTLDDKGKLVMIAPTDYRNGNPEYIEIIYW